MNEAWGVEKQRSFWKHRLVSFLMLVAAGGVMMLALLLVSLIQMAQATWFGAMLASYAWLTNVQSFAFRNLATMLLIVGVGLVFYFIPNAKTRFRDVWVGAEVLVEALDRGELVRGLEQRVQHVEAGLVGREPRALHFHAAEESDVGVAVVLAAPGAAPVLELDHLLGAMGHKILDDVLVA